MAAKPTPVKTLPQIVNGILQRCGQRFVSRMQREHLSGPTGPTSLSVRTGALRRSIYYNTSSTGKTATLEVFGGMFAPYARIHEEGGWITPKNSKYLAIPLQAAKTAAGVSRWTSPRNFPGELVCIKSKAGNLILAKILKRRVLKKLKRSKQGAYGITTTGTGKRTVENQIIPMFVLKDAVFIPPRLNFGKTFEQESARAMTELKLAAQFLGVEAAPGSSKPQPLKGL